MTNVSVPALVSTTKDPVGIATDCRPAGTPVILPLMTNHARSGNGYLYRLLLLRRGQRLR